VIRPHISFAVLFAAHFAAPLFAAPVPKSDGPDVDKLLARVRLENLNATLAQPAVAKAILLTDEQTKKIEKLTDEKLEKAQKQFAAAKGGPGDMDTLAMFAVIGEMSTAFDDELPALLTADQIRRLRQIQLQREGPAALLGRHGMRALNPTAEQEDKLAAEYAKRNRVMMVDEIIAATADGLAEPGRESEALVAVLTQYADDTDAVQEVMLKVLTAEQRATWAKMVGEPLPRKELILAGSPFGDGKLMVGIMKAQFAEAQPPPVVAQPVIPAGGGAPPPALLPPPAAPPPLPVEKK
jgi:hypothetical protein